MAKPKTKREMIAYLEKQFIYPVMNSWNRSRSYARNVKLYNLPIPKELLDKAYDFLELPEAFEEVYELISDFAQRYDYKWNIIFNGRNGGYMVLCKGGKEDSGYKSRCSKCGQLSYKVVTEADGSECGKCGAFARRNLKSPVYRTFISGESVVDSDTYYDSWDMNSLRERFNVVWDFNKTVDECIQAFLNFVKTHEIVLREVKYQKKVKVAKAIA